MRLASHQVHSVAELARVTFPCLWKDFGTGGRSKASNAPVRRSVRQVVIRGQEMFRTNESRGSRHAASPLVNQKIGRS